MKTDEYIFLDENDPLYTPEQMAKAMNVSVGHLANLRSEGGGPRFTKMGPGKRAPIRYFRRQLVEPISGSE